uniref:AAA+ ATPase domain-containing protein n=1 Tax=Pyramimonas orientalis virus TaxID=455367 RepID=A0A7M3UNW1_POV01|nr:hypothetical protein HWQ62_00265 [Pyramimonas orientalis virus]
MAITRLNQKTYESIKTQLVCMDKSTQTADTDFEELLCGKKRKLVFISNVVDDDIDSYHGSDTTTEEDGCSYNSYEEEDEEEDDDDEEDDEDDEEEEDDEDYEEDDEEDDCDMKEDITIKFKTKELASAIEAYLAKRDDTDTDPLVMFKNTLNDDELRYYENLGIDEQQVLENCYRSTMSSEQSSIPMKFQILGADISDYVKNVALQKYNILSNMDSSNSEYNKLHNWITKLCKVPFGKYKNMPVNHDSNPLQIKNFLQSTTNILNEEVYGHSDAKDQIVRIVAQWVSNPKSKGNVIGIHGNPGVGKTTLIKNGVCKALGLPFAFIPLGGASDSSYLDGHSYTYEGSTCGKIVDVLMKHKNMNPVIYFDELDKVSDSPRGQDIINVLIHLTDPSQNNSFQDKYFTDIEFDLSKCLIIFTYNDNNTIDPILKDRMITIHTKDYTTQDKLQITKNHLIPSIKNEFDISNIIIETEDIKYIIEKTEKEAGVRNLKRSIDCIISNLNLERLMAESPDKNLSINKTIIDKYLKNNVNVVNPSLYHMYM